MKNINDVEILDLLPYTFKIPKYRALSRTLKVLKGVFYNMISAAVIWADVENAFPDVLDAMAAELDAPFYSTDMTVEQKRAIIAAAFEYNSKVGTFESVQKLLAAAFGTGNVSEWFDYGGEPYYFRIDVNNIYPGTLTREGYQMFFKNIERVKPARAKIEDLHITHSADGRQYSAAGVIKTYKKFAVPLAEAAENEVIQWNLN